MALSATSSLFLNTSGDDDSTTSPGSPFQFFITLSHKKLFHKIQPIFPSAQLQTVSSGSITCCLEKETNTPLITTTSQGVVESDKATPESPFLQATTPPSSLSHPHRACVPSSSPLFDWILVLFTQTTKSEKDTPAEGWGIDPEATCNIEMSVCPVGQICSTFYILMQAPKSIANISFSSYLEYSY